MTQQTPERIPVEINLHSKSRLLVVAFSDGRRFELPCEYLRVFSRAKEVRTMGTPVVGKEQVNITQIEQQGQYAVRLLFDDGHDTGIYSWDTLYELGERQSENWQAYLDRLTALGYARKSDMEQGKGPRKVKLLYFAYLVQKLRKESEEIEIPEGVTDVQSLIDWLGKSRREHTHLFDLGHVRVTVNKQFSEPFTRIEDGDEVALVPRSQTAPVPKQDTGI